MGLTPASMCSMTRVRYTCGCIKDSEFIQCPPRRDTLFKCPKIDRDNVRDSGNYCLSHCIPENGQKFTPVDVPNTGAATRMYKLAEDGS